MSVPLHLRVGRVKSNKATRLTGRARNACTRSSISPHSRETKLLLMLSIPMARTSSSTKRIRSTLDVVDLLRNSGSSPSASSSPSGAAPGNQEVGALAKLQASQPHQTRPGLPIRSR